MGSGSYRYLVDVAYTCKILCRRPFWINRSHHIKRLIVPYSGMNLVPRQISNDDSYT